MAREQEDRNDAVSERQPRELHENALALANESFDLIFGDAPVMMHSIDEEGKLLRVNRRWTETLGYHRKEVLGRRSIDFLTDESRLQAVEDTLPLFRKTGAARSVGHQFVKNDGGILDILMDADLTRTASGNRFALGALRDRVDTAQWRQAATTMRALKEIADIQRQHEAALAAEVVVYPRIAIPAWEQTWAVGESGGGLSVDLEFHRVTVDDRPVRLTAKEWAILRILVDSAGRVVCPRQVLQEAWGPEYGDEVDYVRSYIRRLRNKLEPDPQHPRYILLERGLGYRLILPE